MFEKMKISAIESISRVLNGMFKPVSLPVAASESESLHKRATWPVSRTYGASHGDQRRLVSTYVPRDASARQRRSLPSTGAGA